MRISFESAKGISFTDVIKQKCFSGLTMIDLLQQENDHKAKPFLFSEGVDTDKRIDVQACLHRDLSGNKVLGYRYVGFERTDPLWLRDKRSTMATRLASQKDPSLAAEMKGMSTEGMSGTAYMAMCSKAKGIEEAIDDYYRVESEPSTEDDIKMMKLLRDIQIEVRGTLTIDEDMFGVGTYK